MKRFLPALLLILLPVWHAVAQLAGEVGEIRGDTAIAAPSFTIGSAVEYLDQAIRRDSLWRERGDSVRMDLERLLLETSEPYDTLASRLAAMDFHTIKVSLEDRFITDSTDIRWLNDSTFVVDSVGWSMDLLTREEIRSEYPVDFSELAFSDSILDENGMLDTTLFVKDTLLVTVIDTAALESLGIPMYRYKNDSIIPSLIRPGRRRSAGISADSAHLLTTDTVSFWLADRNSPFLRLAGMHHLDSMEHAKDLLLAYNYRRDSARLLINDTYGKKMPIWLTSGDSEFTRFWVKNYKNDSITLWIGNPEKNEISLILEDEIDVNRMGRVQLDYLPRQVRDPKRTLAEMKKLEPKPIFWDYDFSSAFTFNQTYLANWTKGGESSVATMLDVTGGAIYNNKEANTQWINSLRLKFGTLITGEKGLRKNNDELVMNSKFNRNASGKIGLSASFYMKNQLARGYSYPNDSVPVSKFLNPGTMTIGLGAEYKPFKHTSLNMAPLSYKNTFVLDTARIDQTKHGVDEDKRAKQELGTQLVVNNKLSPLEDLTVTSTLRLFSNYLNHPENIDVDWELLVDKKINWFFTVRLNLHLIYDDDVKFTVYDADEQPVTLPDGSVKKVAKAQFKEFVGLSLTFKF